MAFSFSPRTVTDGLILNLDAANSRSYVSGSTTWADLSRNNNSSTLTNGPTFNTASGGSIVFDGVDDFVLSTHPTTNIFSSLTSYTVSFWIRVTSYGGNGSVLLSATGSNNLFMQVQSGSAYIGTLGSPNNFLTLTTNDIGNISLNKISNIVWVKNSTTALFYLNGTQYTFPGSATFTFTGLDRTINIGKYTSSGFNLPGNIYNMSVYNKALTATEILQNYNSLKTRFGL
jgi:microcystin-dependent protein